MEQQNLIKNYCSVDVGNRPGQSDMENITGATGMPCPIFLNDVKCPAEHTLYLLQFILVKEIC